VRQRQHHGELLLVAARQVADGAIKAQIELRGQGLGALGGPKRVGAADGVDHVVRLHPVEQIRRLGDVAEAFAHRIGQVGRRAAEQEGGAGGRFGQAGQAAQQRRLAGAPLRPTRPTTEPAWISSEMARRRVAWSRCKPRLVARMAASVGFIVGLEG
jgi:hypothetical protein